MKKLLFVLCLLLIGVGKYATSQGVVNDPSVPMFNPQLAQGVGTGNAGVEYLSPAESVFVPKIDANGNEVRTNNNGDPYYNGWFPSGPVVKEPYCCRNQSCWCIDGEIQDQ